MTQNVYIYRGKHYYENTLPKEALNRTLDGYNLFKLVNGEFIKILIEGSETIGELKRTLKAHGLKVSGTRIQCEDRLNNHLFKRMLN